MQAALEIYLIDLMGTFNGFGIKDQNNQPFDPEHFDFNNPDHFAKLKLFEIGLDQEIPEDMGSHASLLFYDPACDGINQNPALKAELGSAANNNPDQNDNNAAPKTKWVDATQHPYPVNAGKAMWNIGLKTLIELRELCAAANSGASALGTKLYALYNNQKALETYIKNHGKYLDKDAPTEPEAAEQNIHSNNIPKVVDARTLAFAECSLRFLNHTMLYMPDPFREVTETILNEKILQQLPFLVRPFIDPIRKLIQDKQQRSIVGFKVAQPKLLERICLYQARTVTQTEEVIQAEHEKITSLGDLATRVTANPEEYPADFGSFVDTQLDHLSKDANTPIENRIATLEELHNKLLEIDRLLELKPTFLLNGDYAKTLYQNNNPNPEFYVRLDLNLGTREYVAAALKHLYPEKNVQQIIAAQTRLKENLEKTRANLKKILEARRSENNNAVALQKKLIEENQRLQTALAEKRQLIATAKAELKQFDTAHSEEAKAALETLESLAPQSESLEEAQQALLSKAENDSAIGSIWSSVSSPIATFGSFFQNSAQPTSAPKEKELTAEDLDRQQQALEKQLKPARETLAKINEGSEPIIARFSILESEAREISERITTNEGDIKKHQLVINEKIRNTETQIRGLIDKLNSEIKEQFQTIQKTKGITISDFENKTKTFFEKLNAIQDQYNFIKQINQTLWDSEQLSKVKQEFEFLLANYPLTNSDIKHAIALIINDYNAVDPKYKIMKWRRRKNTEKFATAFMTMIKVFMTTNTPQGKINALVEFKQVCDKLTLPRNTSVAVGIILGILTSIIIAGLLISGWGFFFAAGVTAILSATLLTKVAAASVIYTLGVLGMSFGWAIGGSATPAITKNYQLLGKDCENACSALEKFSSHLPAQKLLEANKFEALELDLGEEELKELGQTDGSYFVYQ